MILDEFLSTTRMFNGNPNNYGVDFDAFYGNLLAEVSTATPSYWDIAVELRVVKSLNKSCQIVPTNDGRFLVYDQHLGQTLNFLTKLFYSAQTKDAATPYSYRIMAEELRCCGQDKLAVFFAWLYYGSYSVVKEEISKEDEGELFRRRKAVEIQEAFAISHEIAHLLWPQQRLDTLAIDWLLDTTLPEERDESDDDAWIESYLDDLSHLHHGEPIPHEANIQTAAEREQDIELRQQLKDQSKKRRAENAMRRAAAMKDDLFREEIFCDHSAHNDCLEIYRENVPIEDLITAVYLTLENLTTLSLLQHLVRDALGFVDSERPAFTALRKQALRQMLQYEFDERQDSDGTPLRSAWAVIKEANIRYMRFVRDPMTLGPAAHYSKIVIQNAEYFEKVVDILAPGLNLSRDQEFWFQIPITMGEVQIAFNALAQKL